MDWHIITGEYPPQPGGVSDYTRLIARELVSTGDTVEVWTSQWHGSQPTDNAVKVNRLPGRFGPHALAKLDRVVGSGTGDRILVQYVPHAFGFKAMNLAFCLWLFAHRRCDITVMFHEVAFPKEPEQSLRHRLLAWITSLMAKMAVRSATRIYISCESWEKLLRPMARCNQSITWMPVASNVPVVNDAAATSLIRRKYAPSGLLVGHLGTYSASVRQSLDLILPPLLKTSTASAMLLGYGSTGFCDEMAQRHPAIRHKIHGAGGLDNSALSLHLSACDLMIQPYPDGISTRRTSAMAALAHGIPVITSRGRLTEAVWTESGAVAAEPSNDPLHLSRTAQYLMSDVDGRKKLGSRGQQLYRDRFDVRHTIAQLRQPSCVSL